MVNQLPTPPSENADAKNRAWRTLLQSLAVDVVAALVVALTPVLSDVQWTKGYWLLVAGLAGRSVVTAGLSWVARKVLPPAP
ncbi:MAG TPA: hypothetical protein VHK64_05660 [Nocardioidaceae bacterium]|jgi:hypothetical protein|nr:hypothetical protein [Nocardioidaceae bacterium]